MRAIRIAASTLVREICAPMDKSMPPEIITKAMPTALMAVNDTWRSRMMKLFGVAKFGAIIGKEQNQPEQHQQSDILLHQRKGIARQVSCEGRIGIHGAPSINVSPTPGREYGSG